MYHSLHVGTQARLLTRGLAAAIARRVTRATSDAFCSIMPCLAMLAPRERALQRSTDRPSVRRPSSRRPKLRLPTTTASSACRGLSVRERTAASVWHAARRTLSQTERAQIHGTFLLVRFFFFFFFFFSFFLLTEGGGARGRADGRADGAGATRLLPCHARTRGAQLDVRAARFARRPTTPARCVRGDGSSGRRACAAPPSPPSPVHGRCAHRRRRLQLPVPADAAASRSRFTRDHSRRAPPPLPNSEGTDVRNPHDRLPAGVRERDIYSNAARPVRLVRCSRIQACTVQACFDDAIRPPR